MTVLVGWACVLTSGVCLHEKLQNLAAEQRPHNQPHGQFSCSKFVFVRFYSVSLVSDSVTELAFLAVL